MPGLIYLPVQNKRLWLKQPNNGYYHGYYTLPKNEYVYITHTCLYEIYKKKLWIRVHTYIIFHEVNKSVGVDKPTKEVFFKRDVFKHIGSSPTFIEPAKKIQIT